MESSTIGPSYMYYFPTYDRENLLGLCNKDRRGSRASGCSACMKMNNKWNQTEDRNTMFCA